MGICSLSVPLSAKFEADCCASAVRMVCYEKFKTDLLVYVQDTLHI